MKIELHVIQNFGPANLNRDDTGSPKACVFAGHRRARISSQCLKRAVRQMYVHESDVATDSLGLRTKRLAGNIADVLSERGVDSSLAKGLAMAGIEGCGFGSKSAKGDERYMTQYLLYVPRRIVTELADIIIEHREVLEPYVSSDDVANNEEDKKKSSKDKKKAKKKALPKALSQALLSCIEDARKTPDIALFGRMIADSPKWNVEASCQVAHAISTNRLSQEFDFYTAVDDLLPAGESGSDMMGTIGFNASCFYRYAVLDVDGLKSNLGDDAPDGLLEGAIRGFVRGFVRAIPTGKQNSMAAHSPPSFVLAIVRNEGQPISLVNAFAKPAKPGRDDAGHELDLIDNSIDSLMKYFARLKDEYGDAELLAWADRDFDGESVRQQASLTSLYSAVTEHAVR